MISAGKTDSYVPPQAKVMELNARGAIMTLSQNAGNSQNEQLDDNIFGFGDDFWN